MLGGTDEGPLHLGAIAAAVIRLAYDSPKTEYTVRFTAEPISKLSPWTAGVVTRVELGVRIRRLVSLV